ncbi:MAG: DNA sulfur modification protein DndD, partial [Balneolaceae bacterium]
LSEQLNDDLNYYLRKKGGGNKYDILKEEVLVKQQFIDHLNTQISEVRDKQLDMEEQEKELQSRISGYERELASEGGDYAARRPIIKDRINQLDSEIHEIEAKIHDLCAGLLPFTLAPVLSQKLFNRLKSELDTHREAIASDILDKKVDSLKKRLQDSNIWDESGVNSEAKSHIINEITGLLQANAATKDSGNILIHELSENDVLKVQNWIREAANSVPELALHLSHDLKKKNMEKEEHQEYLKRAPDDDKLEPIFEKIRGTEEKLVEIRKQNKLLSEKIGSLQFKLEQAEREHEAVVSNLKEIEKETRKFSMAEKSRLVLQSYNEKISALRVEKLCEELTECFNRICDKDSLLSSAEIDPDTYNVSLTGLNGESVTVDDFSMGESQIYGLALLWALRKISGYELPLLIDTPVARLDKVHRANFINEFVPEVSDQVLLFATNVEMSDELHKEIEPRLAHLYELSFDEKEGMTSVAGSGHKCETKERKELKAS